MADEYAHRMGCDEGFRDAKWWLGFAKARIPDLRAWSRMFVVVATTMLAIASLSVTVLLSDKAQAARLLRRVTSRRRGRCELSWFSAMLLLLVQNLNLLSALSPHVRLDLNTRLPNVS